MGYSHFKNENGKTGLYLAGMIMGILAIIIGIIQYFAFEEVYDAKSELNNTIEEGLFDIVKDQILDSIQYKSDSTLIDSSKVDE